MIKGLFIIIISLFGFCLNGQTTENKPIYDGYYYGKVEDSINVKYIFIKFLSDEEDILYIKPYIFNNNNNYNKELHSEFLKSLKSNGSLDGVDGNILEEQKWSITGFDNYSYYTTNDGLITFSLNIANINNQNLDVFEFNGRLIKNGTLIESVVNSTEGTFKNETLLLTYKKIPK